MGTKFEINTKMLKRLEDIPVQFRLGPLDRCMKAFAKPIAEAAKALAPSSRSTGSRKKWSKRFANDPKFSGVESSKHTGFKVLKNGSVIIGFKFEKGNKQQFINPSRRGAGREQNFWGAPGQVIKTISRRGTPYTYIRKTGSVGVLFHRSNRAVVRAFDQNKSVAKSEFIMQAQREAKGFNLG